MVSATMKPEEIKLLQKLFECPAKDQVGTRWSKEELQIFYQGKANNLG